MLRIVFGWSVVVTDDECDRTSCMGSGRPGIYLSIVSCSALGYFIVAVAGAERKKMFGWQREE